PGAAAGVHPQPAAKQAEEEPVDDGLPGLRRLSRTPPMPANGKREAACLYRSSIYIFTFSCCWVVLSLCDVRADLLACGKIVITATLLELDFLLSFLYDVAWVTLAMT
uniref:Uncharacterized protein n=1 Tax=Aegilops tauschii subsp. strangulata TaxID=200361 RepID=A0A453L8S9_AEGTS